MKTEGHHIHPVQTAALDPQEILRDTTPLRNWLKSKGGQDANASTKLEALILQKNAPEIWKIIKDVHLRLSSKFPEEEEALIGWTMLQSLERAYSKWLRFAFPYNDIYNPPAENLEEAESRCREALLLTMSFEPFLRGTPQQPKERETSRHCLAYTLLSCLHSETPSLEGDLKRLKEMAFAKKLTPNSRETPRERTMILAQSILILSYGGAVAKNEWSRPNQQSIADLLRYIYENPEGRINHLIPQETRDIYETLKKLQLL